MAYRKRRNLQRHGYLMVLVGVTVVALLLPSAWTGKLISLVQIIVPFQHASVVAGESIREALTPEEDAVSAEAYEAATRQTLALEHQVAALSLRTAELEQEVELLTATRSWGVGGRQIGSAGRLIPARVITDDLLSWRASKLINTGTLQGVRRGSAVTSRTFTIGMGSEEGVRSGLAILLREVFIGVVEQAGTHTARVKLLSDVTVQRKVRLGRFTENGFAPLEPYFWLTGRGNGVMQIRNIDRRDVDAETIAVGDVVLADAMSEEVPAALVIGKVTEIQSDVRNPLLSILTVRGVVDEASLRTVYVYDPRSPAEAGE